MWVWLKLKLTPKSYFCVVSVRAFFVNFFMYSTKRYVNRQIVTTHPKHHTWDQNLQFTTQSLDEQPRQFYMGVLPGDNLRPGSSQG